MRKGVSPPRAPVQKDKQTDDAISTTTWEATSTNRTERRRRSAKTKDDGKPKTPIEKLTIPPAPSPPNISDPTTTGKRKREATPEKTSKKLKASEEILEPNSSKEEGAQDSEEQPELEICPMCGEEYDPEDEDEDTVCEFHPGELVIDRKAPCWKSEWGVDPYDDEDVEEFLSSHGYYSGMLMWDCCGYWEGAPGCEKQGAHGEY